AGHALRSFRLPALAPPPPAVGGPLGNARRVHALRIDVAGDASPVLPGHDRSAGTVGRDRRVFLIADLRAEGDTIDGPLRRSGIGDPSHIDVPGGAAVVVPRD